MRDVTHSRLTKDERKALARDSARAFALASVWKRVAELRDDWKSHAEAASRPPAARPTA